MKLKLAVIFSVFPVLALFLFPVCSWASYIGPIISPDNDLGNQPILGPTKDREIEKIMNKCIDSPKHLIKQSGRYYACVDLHKPEGLNDISNPSAAQARANKLVEQAGVNHCSCSQIPVLLYDGLFECKPSSTAEKKKLDNFIQGKTPEEKSSTGEKNQNAINAGMSSQQKQALNQKVAGATGQVSGAFKSPASGGTPTPSSKKMGTITQAQGQQGTTPATGSNPANPSQTSGTAASAVSGASSKSNAPSPTTQAVQKPVNPPPAPTKPADKPKKSKPGFFAKIWNGIKKVGHYIITSRIGTGLILAGAAALMLTGFGAAPGVIIAASVLGAGIGLAAGPLTQGGPSKSLPPPAPLASSPSSSRPAPASASPQPTPTAPPEALSQTASLNANGTSALAKARKGAESFDDKKDSGVQAGPSAVVRPNKTPFKKSVVADRTPKTSHHSKAAEKNSTKPAKPKNSPPEKTSYIGDMLKGAVVVGAVGAGIGAIAGPWGAAIGAASGAVVGIAIAAGRDYLKNKEASSKAVRPAAQPKNQNPPKPPAWQAASLPY